MFLEIRELEQKPIRFAQVLQPGELQFDEDFDQLSSLSANGGAEWQASTEEIRVWGRFSVTLRMECNRCANPFSQEVAEEFDLIYAPAMETEPGAEIAIGASDSNISFYEGVGLELNDILREQVLLAVPMQRLCREDCQGICAACGQDRNEGGCDCQETAVDERWAALKRLKDESPK